jgi:hypothetical protein
MKEIGTGIFKIEDNKDIYIIGDIHGDYQVLLHCLVDLCEVAKISGIERDIEFQTEQREVLEWKTGNDSIIVFCGDLIHRKRFDIVLDDECSDIYIINTVLRLKESAKSNGGDILIVSGNHEIMSILDPDDMGYTSSRNEDKNKEYFKNTKFINKYINNSYAWLKINDILIAHGGLCSDYLRFLDGHSVFSGRQIFTGGSGATTIKKIKNKKIFMIGGNKISFGDEIVQYINDLYREYFANGLYKRSKVSERESIAYKLFVEYDMHNKSTHNMFWCRQWGYNEVNCDDLISILEKVGCGKMIVAHCPQFLSEPEQKMINFECIIEGKGLSEQYRLARVDLGMSRSFEYNEEDKFMEYLQYNRNRKMSVLKLLYDNKNHNYYFNYSGVITKRLSCIQYLLLKYGKTKKEWLDKSIITDWLGFDVIEHLLGEINSERQSMTGNTEVILNLLEPVIRKKEELKSINSYERALV